MKYSDINLVKKKLVIGVSSLLLMSASSFVNAKEISQHKMNIDAQVVDAALFELAELSGIQIVLDREVQKNIQLPAVRGNFSVSEALNRMLDGSGLSYEFTSDDLVVVKKSEISKSQDKGLSKDIEEVIVTGSRLRNVAPTSPVVVITREDIERQGLSSAEDIVRSLPQNFSSVNTATSVSDAGGSEDTPYGGEGHSFANLRGLGTSGTLILINGRRTAGSAIFDGGKVNLATIPAGAIDRVEILLDGASAIYGSDALGGVINFILKDKYSGAKTSVRYENSANDGDSYELNQTIGFGWDSGDALIQLRYKQRDGVSAWKAGYNSRDFSSRGGNNLVSGNLQRAYGSPGNVSTASRVHLGSLPEGHDGVNWTIDDLSVDNVKPYDKAKYGQGGTVDTKSTSVNFNVEQDLFSGVSLFANGMYSVSDNWSTNGASLGYLKVSKDNPYNHTGEDLVVRYVFDKEVAEGLLRYGSNYGKNTKMHAVLGLRAELFSDWELSAEVTGSYSKSLANNDYIDRATGSPLRDALNGKDAEGNPVPAFNPFGDQLAHDPDVNFDAFMKQNTPRNPGAMIKRFEVSADGTLMSIAGGDVKLALGFTYRPEKFDFQKDKTKARIYKSPTQVWEREVSALFFEGYIPLIGSDNSMPGIESLLVTVAGRYDEYNFEGFFGLPEEPKSEKSFSSFSPKLGVLWEPIDTLKIRASRSESFRAPGLRSLMEGTTFWGHGNFLDPNINDIVRVPTFRASNPDLEPETAVSLSAGFDWSPGKLPGLMISSTYSKVDWEGRLGTASPWDTYIRTHVNEFPEVFIRDAAGNLEKVVQRPINMSQKVIESVDFSITYDFDTEWGNFIAQLTGVVNLKNKSQILPISPVENPIETEQGPDKVVYKARLGWDRMNYGANLMFNYSSGYKNNYTGGEWEYDHDYDEWKFNYNPPEMIEHWSTWDLTGYYEFDSGMKVSAGVRNLLNNKFPFINDESRGYDGRRVDIRGRVAYMEITKEFDF